MKLDSRTFEDISEYLKISLPFVVTLCLDFWSYDIMTFVSGIIGVSSQAAAVVMMNMCALAYSISSGLQSAAGSFQGNMVGKGDPVAARESYNFIMIFCTSIISLECCLLYFYREKFLKSMTDEESVLEVSLPLLFYFVINTWLESFRGFIRGLIRAEEL